MSGLQRERISVRHSVDTPQVDATVNVVGTIRVAEAARSHGVRHVSFVHGSPPGPGNASLPFRSSRSASQPGSGTASGASTATSASPQAVSTSSRCATSPMVLGFSTMKVTSTRKIES